MTKVVGSMCKLHGSMIIFYIITATPSKVFPLNKTRLEVNNVLFLT